MLVLFPDLSKLFGLFWPSTRLCMAFNPENRVLQFFIFSLSQNMAFEERWRLLRQSQLVVGGTSRKPVEHGWVSGIRSIWNQNYMDFPEYRVSEVSWFKSIWYPESPESRVPMRNLEHIDSGVYALSWIQSIWNTKYLESKVSRIRVCKVNGSIRIGPLVRKISKRKKAHRSVSQWKLGI